MITSPARTEWIGKAKTRNRRHRYTSCRRRATVRSQWFSTHAKASYSVPVRRCTGTIKEAFRAAVACKGLFLLTHGTGHTPCTTTPMLRMDGGKVQTESIGRLFSKPDTKLIVCWYDGCVPMVAVPTKQTLLSRACYSAVVLIGTHILGLFRQLHLCHNKSVNARKYCSLADAPDGETP